MKNRPRGFYRLADYGIKSFAQLILGAMPRESWTILHEARLVTRKGFCCFLTKAYHTMLGLSSQA